MTYWIGELIALEIGYRKWRGDRDETASTRDRFIRFGISYYVSCHVDG